MRWGRGHLYCQSATSAECRGARTGCAVGRHAHATGRACGESCDGPPRPASLEVSRRSEAVRARLAEESGGQSRGTAAAIEAGPGLVRSFVRATRGAYCAVAVCAAAETGQAGRGMRAVSSLCLSARLCTANTRKEAAAGQEGTAMCGRTHGRVHGGKHATSCWAPTDRPTR